MVGIASKPLGDSGRIVWGDFRVCRRGKFLFRQQVRASAPAGVAPEPLGDSDQIAWGVLSAGVSVCTLVGVASVFSFWPIVSRSVVPDVWLRPRDGTRRSFIYRGIGRAEVLSESESWIRGSDE